VEDTKGQSDHPLGTQELQHCRGGWWYCQWDESKRGFDEEGAELIIEATKKFKSVPPGRVEIHYDSTGFSKLSLKKKKGY